MALGLSTGPPTSTPASIPSSSEKEEILYCCTVGIPSKIDEKRHYSLRGKYQILDELNPHIIVPSE